MFDEPAFPVVGDGVRAVGMTLRDYFAAKVATGLMTESDCVTPKDWKVFAEAAYGFADAMLEARQKGGQG